MGIYRDGIASIFLILQRDFNLTRTQIGMYTMAIHLVLLSGIFTGQLIDIKGSK